MKKYLAIDLGGTAIKYAENVRRNRSFVSKFAVRFIIFCALPGGATPTPAMYTGESAIVHSLP